MSTNYMVRLYRCYVENKKRSLSSELPRSGREGFLGEGGSKSGQAGTTHEEVG